MRLMFDKLPQEQLQNSYAEWLPPIITLIGNYIRRPFAGNHPPESFYICCETEKALQYQWWAHKDTNLGPAD